MLVLLTSILFLSCKKDKYSSTPQITYTSLSPDSWSRENLNPNGGPLLTFQLTDAEGDFGFQDGKDTSYVYVKNLTIPPFEMDSFKFPALPLSDKKNLNVAVDVSLTEALKCSPLPSPHTDTIYFEVYVQDFAKNKSNVLQLPQPVYYYCP